MGARDLLAAKPTGKIYYDLTSGSITTAAWREIEDSIPASCTAIMVAWSGDAVLKLAKGAAGSEVELPIYITPGQAPNVLIPLELSKAWRLAARAEDQNVTVGRLVITLFG